LLIATALALERRSRNERYDNDDDDDDGDGSMLMKDIVDNESPGANESLRMIKRV
jgi:hypothetical protein